ncbi:hypothetical protein C5S35_00470 [Candidatus Methanophagaceae archaeon]|nr:hypothetical protein C5S35_00470 [Methanophagales archaeon]
MNQVKTNGEIARITIVIALLIFNSFRKSVYRLFPLVTLSFHIATQWNGEAVKKKGFASWKNASPLPLRSGGVK